MVRQKMRGDVATYRRIAVVTITAESGHRDRARVEMHVVGMKRVADGTIAGDRNVDGRINRNTCVDETSREMPAAAVAGAVVTGIDRIGAEPEARGKQIYVPTECDVAVTAVAPDAGHLNGALIDIHIVHLVGVGTGIVSCHHDFDRIVQDERCVRDASMKEAVAAIAGLVAPG